jgi:hypothetical protein
MATEGFWKAVFENWERFFFSIVGLLLVGYSLRLIYIGQTTNAAIVFGLGSQFHLRECCPLQAVQGFRI